MTAPVTSPNGEWLPWKGGECPVEPNTMVEIKAVVPGETEERVLFPRMAWANRWDSPHFVAYRVVQS